MLNANMPAQPNDRPIILGVIQRRTLEDEQEIAIIGGGTHRHLSANPKDRCPK